MAGFLTALCCVVDPLSRMDGLPVETAVCAESPATSGGNAWANAWVLLVHWQRGKRKVMRIRRPASTEHSYTPTGTHPPPTEKGQAKR